VGTVHRTGGKKVDETVVFLKKTLAFPVAQNLWESISQL
jgi:hypothetical protein